MSGTKGSNVGRRKLDLPPPHRSFGDPDHAPDALRCFACGAPDQPGRLKVYPGLWGYIRFNVGLGLCERCIVLAAERDANADLMALEDVA